MPHAHLQGLQAAREQAGLSAIELMVVVLVLGLLAAVAAPSLTLLLERWRVRQAAEDLAGTLALARAEAVRRGGGVVLRRQTPNSTDCPGIAAGAEQWGCGWTVFLDTDADGAPGADEQTLRVSHAPHGVQVQRRPAAAYLRLNRWGEAGLGAYGFVIRPLRESSDVATALCVSSGGRIDLRPGAQTC